MKSREEGYELGVYFISPGGRGSAAQWGGGEESNAQSIQAQGMGKAVVPGSGTG